MGGASYGGSAFGGGVGTFGGTGMGGALVNQGGALVNQGGTSVTQGGALVTQGGATVTYGGASTLGGATGAGGSTTSLACGTNLLEGNLGTNNNWIGGDSASTADNPCGVQGAIYGFSDGTSCTVPTTLCTAGQCCISGATIVDATYAAYGCGIGVSLNDSGGTTSVKSAYSGTATSFRITISGTSAAPIRIIFKQTASDTEEAPYEEVAGPGTYTLTFADPTCPTWTTTCTTGGPPFDIQVQVAGGDTAGAFDICLTELTPL